jgi:uncharacterized protein (TIGR04222 family)
MGSSRIRSSQIVLHVLVAVIVVALTCMSAPLAIGAQTDDNDSDDEERRPVTITPSNLLQPADRNNIERIVNELAAFGTTVGVVVQLVDAPTEDTQATAAELYEDDPVEGEPDAGDGLLILVEIPRGAHQATTIGFAAGPNFYPRGGITPERLAEVVATNVQPLIDRSNIGDSIVSLMQWIAVIQLFEPSPRVELTERQSTLNRALNQVAAPILVLLALSLVGVAFWSRRHTRRFGRDLPGAEVEALDAVQAGALARGRADDAALTGALLGLYGNGAASVGAPRRDGPALRLLDASRLDRAVDQLAWDVTSPLADPATRQVTASRLRQLLDVWPIARRELEGALGAQGLFDPLARRADATIALLSMFAGAAAVLLVIPVLIARATAAIGAVIVLLAVAFLVWQWSRHRSWTTARGSSALHNWRAVYDGDDPQRVIYDVITRQDRATDNRFVSIRSSLGEMPFRPLNDLVTTVRNFGRT